MYTWGRGDSGQLGVSDRWRAGESMQSPGTHTPTLVEFSSTAPAAAAAKITSISLGAFHTGCIDSDGRLWTFGKEVTGAQHGTIVWSR